MARPRTFDPTQALDKAMQVFWKKGYHGTCMEELVTTMGVNRASLYKTFGDKHRLYIAALKRYVQQNRASLAHPPTQGPVLPALRQFFLSMAYEDVTDADRKGCMIVQSVQERLVEDPEVEVIASTNYADMIHYFSKWILAGQKRGEIPTSQNPETLAAYLYASFNGLRHTALIQPSPATLEALTDTILSSLTATPKIG